MRKPIPIENACGEMKVFSALPVWSEVHREFDPRLPSSRVWQMIKDAVEREGEE